LKEILPMKIPFILIMIFVVFTAAGQSAQDDVWEPLRFLEGVWIGSGEGTSGNSTAVQEYSFILNGNFILMKAKSEFKPQEKNSQGEIHEDIGIFSYDQSRQAFILRGFYVEGFVNQYVGKISKDGKTLIFESESIENAPVGTRAKLEFLIKSPNELEQNFYVAWPGQDFTCFSKNILKKK